MGARMSFDQLEETMRRLMEDDMGEEPQTPKEQAQIKVEMAARDCWLAASDLYKLRLDPIAKEFFSAQVEGELWSIKARIDSIIDDIRGERGEFMMKPVLRVVQNNG
jgi:hypothetical protein